MIDPELRAEIVAMIREAMEAQNKFDAVDKPLDWLCNTNGSVFVPIYDNSGKSLGRQVSVREVAREIKEALRNERGTR